MKVLYLTDSEPDYLADQIYDGLCTMLGGRMFLTSPEKPRITVRMIDRRLSPSIEKVGRRRMRWSRGFAQDSLTWSCCLRRDEGFNRRSVPSQIK